MMRPVTPAELKSFLVDFIGRHPLAVQASVADSGAPQAAVVGVVVKSDLTLFFDTLSSSRKAHNLRRDPRMAFVIGWDLDEAQTVQYEGTADEPAGEELAQLKEIYFARFPDGRTRETMPDIAYFRVRPQWVRYSDFRSAVLNLVELDLREP
jgi:general stress protein 26